MAGTDSREDTDAPRPGAGIERHLRGIIAAAVTAVSCASLAQCTNTPVRPMTPNAIITQAGSAVSEMHTFVNGFADCGACSHSASGERLRVLAIDAMPDSTTLLVGSAMFEVPDAPRIPFVLPIDPAWLRGGHALVFRATLRDTNGHLKAYTARSVSVSAANVSIELPMIPFDLR